MRGVLGDSGPSRDEMMVGQIDAGARPLASVNRAIAAYGRLCPIGHRWPVRCCVIVRSYRANIRVLECSTC